MQQVSWCSASMALQLMAEGKSVPRANSAQGDGGKRGSINFVTGKVLCIFIHLLCLLVQTDFKGAFQGEQCYGML